MSIDPLSGLSSQIPLSSNVTPASNPTLLPGSTTLGSTNGVTNPADALASALSSVTINQQVLNELTTSSFVSSLLNANSNNQATNSLMSFLTGQSPASASGAASSSSNALLTQLTSRSAQDPLLNDLSAAGNTLLGTSSSAADQASLEQAFFEGQFTSAYQPP